MIELAEISSFTPLLEMHGLSRWWIYKQWRQMRSYKFLRTDEGKKYTLVPREEMLAKILIASKRITIATLLGRSWNVLVGKRMTYLVSRSHGTWQRHYGTPRAHARIVISSPSDLLALRPKFYFFKDGIEHLAPVLADEDLRAIKHFLNVVEKEAKRIIYIKCKDNIYQQKIAFINYDEFFSLLLDKMIYGETPDKAFEISLCEAPQYYEYSSSFEVQPGNENFIENFSSNRCECLHDFRIDFKKLKKQFFNLLLSERLKSIHPCREKVIKAYKETALDMSIFILHLQHATDEEICNRLHFKGTRQRLTQRRQRILEKARPVFSILRD